MGSGSERNRLWLAHLLLIGFGLLAAAAVSSERESGRPPRSAAEQIQNSTEPIGGDSDDDYDEQELTTSYLVRPANKSLEADSGPSPGTNEDDDYNDYGAYILAYNDDGLSVSRPPSANDSMQVVFFAASSRANADTKRQQRRRQRLMANEGANLIDKGADRFAASYLLSNELKVELEGEERRLQLSAADGQQDCNELESDDAKWLAKMRARAKPDDQDRRRVLKQTGALTQSEANELISWQHQELNETTAPVLATGHNIHYWRLVWAVLPLGATFGNLLVILAVYNEKSLQSVTNYFIVSLAFADLFVGIIVMPFAVYVLVNDVWELSDSICDMYVAVDVTSSTASILNLVAISIDRYRAVAHPIAYSARSSSTRAIITIILVWAISCCVGAPIILGLNTSPEREGTLCILYNSTFIFWSSLASFYIPCIVMIGLYWRIFSAIRSRTKKAIGSSSSATTPAGATTTAAGQVTGPANYQQHNQQKHAAAGTQANQLIDAPGVANAIAINCTSSSKVNAQATTVSLATNKNKTLTTENITSKVRAIQESCDEGQRKLLNSGERPEAPPRDRGSSEPDSRSEVGRPQNSGDQVLACPLVSNREEAIMIAQRLLATVVVSNNQSNEPLSSSNNIRFAAKRLANCLCQEANERNCQLRFLSRIEDFRLSLKVTKTNDSFDLDQPEVVLAILSMMNLKDIQTDTLIISAQWADNPNENRTEHTERLTSLIINVINNNIPCEKPEVRPSKAFKVESVLVKQLVDTLIGSDDTPSNLILRAKCSIGKMRENCDIIGKEQTSPTCCCCCKASIDSKKPRKEVARTMILCLIEPLLAQDQLRDCCRNINPQKNFAKVTLSELDIESSESKLTQFVVNLAQIDPRSAPSNQKSLVSTGSMLTWTIASAKQEKFDQFRRARGQLCHDCQLNCLLMSSSKLIEKTKLNSNSSSPNKSAICCNYQPKQYMCDESGGKHDKQQQVFECSHLSKLLKEEHRVAKRPSLVYLEDGMDCGSDGESSDTGTSDELDEDSRRSSSLSANFKHLAKDGHSHCNHLNSDEDDDDITYECSMKHRFRGANDNDNDSRNSSSRRSCCQNLNNSSLNNSPINCSTCEKIMLATSCSLIPAISSSKNIDEFVSNPKRSGGSDQRIAALAAPGRDAKKSVGEVTCDCSMGSCHEDCHTTSISRCHSKMAPETSNSDGKHQSACNEKSSTAVTIKDQSAVGPGILLNSIKRRSLRISQFIRGKPGDQQAAGRAKQQKGSAGLVIKEHGDGSLEQDPFSTSLNQASRMNNSSSMNLIGGRTTTDLIPSSVLGPINCQLELSSTNLPNSSTFFDMTSKQLTTDGDGCATTSSSNTRQAETSQQGAENHLVGKVQRQSTLMSFDSPNAIRSSQPNKGVAIISQNPKKDPTGSGLVANLLNHLRRQQQQQQAKLMGSHKARQHRHPIATSNQGKAAAKTQSAKEIQPAARSHHRAGSRRRREKNAARRERRATKTLAIVLGIFLICWTPFFTCNIIDGFCIRFEMDCRPGMMVYLVTSWLGYINSCVNPIIYTIFNMEFRRAFKKILTSGSNTCCSCA